MINQNELIAYRQQLIAELVSDQNRLYYTAGLLSIIRNWILTDKIPTAGIDTKLNLYLGQIITDYPTFKYVVLHEISHIAHMAQDSKYIAPDAMKEFKGTKFHQWLLNISMDTALNENLKKLIPVEYEKVIKPREMEFATFESFDTMFKPLDENDKTEPEQSAQYYAHLAWKRIKDDVDKAKQQAEGEGNGEFDQHDFDNMSEEERQAVEKKLKEADELGKNLGVKAGRSALDNPITTKKVKVPEHIVRMLKKISTKVAKIISSRESTDDNFRRPRERAGFLLPTDSTDFKKVKESQIVMVLDTSGSMFSEEVLSHSASLADRLIKAKKVMAAYCCDTELKPLKLDNVFNKIAGGGGTDLTNAHVDQIRAEHKIPKKIQLDIVYITDGEVDLTEIKSNKHVKLHVIYNKGGELHD